MSNNNNNNNNNGNNGNNGKGKEISGFFIPKGYLKKEKRYIIIEDADLTQEILNITEKYNTKYLRWNQNKGMMQSKKWVIDVEMPLHNNLLNYYPHSKEEIEEILEDSQWQGKEV